MKKKPIKHWVTEKGVYLCNQAYTAKPEKTAEAPHDVTCKKCIRKIVG